uniref:Uncharacterized protein n=1 Tax=Gopherus agassizii TaxID=38772 RepID=A0A452HVG7_9SAUR
MAAAARCLQLPTVEIDPDGTFKYILVLVLRAGGAEHQDVIRGTAAAEFHNHIFEKVTGRDCEPGTHIVALGISGPQPLFTGHSARQGLAEHGVAPGSAVLHWPSHSLGTPPLPACLLHSCSTSSWGRLGLPQGADQSLRQCKQLG